MHNIMLHLSIICLCMHAYACGLYSHTHPFMYVHIHASCLGREGLNQLLLKQRLAGHGMHGHACIPGDGLASCALYI